MSFVIALYTLMDGNKELCAVSYGWPWFCTQIPEGEQLVWGRMLGLKVLKVQPLTCTGATPRTSSWVVRDELSMENPAFPPSSRESACSGGGGETKRTIASAPTCASCCKEPASAKSWIWWSLEVSSYVQFCDSVQCRCWCYHRQWYWWLLYHFCPDVCQWSMSVSSAVDSLGFLSRIEAALQVSLEILLQVSLEICLHLGCQHLSALGAFPKEGQSKGEWRCIGLKLLWLQSENLVLRGGDITTEMLLRRWSGTGRGFSGRWLLPQTCSRVWTLLRGT